MLVEEGQVAIPFWRSYKSHMLNEQSTVHMFSAVSCRKNLTLPALLTEIRSGFMIPSDPWYFPICKNSMCHRESMWYIQPRRTRIKMVANTDKDVLRWSLVTLKVLKKVPVGSSPVMFALVSQVLVAAQLSMKNCRLNMA